MIDHDTLRPHLVAAMTDALGMVLDAYDFDSTAETVLDGLVERLNARPATLPTETVQTAADSVYGPAELRREYLPADGNTPECVKLTIDPGDDVEWPVYLTADQWATVTA